MAQVGALLSLLLALFIPCPCRRSGHGGAKRNIKVDPPAPLARTRMTEDFLAPFAEQLDPAQVSPVVAWLAHADCPVR